MFLFLETFSKNVMIKEPKKIILIGPVYPYKGGISHYTGMLCRALRKKYDVIMISYKLQYPKCLFKKEQRDFSNDSFEIKDTNYWLNTANPINWIHSAFNIKRKKPDLVIIQWWHPYFAPCYWMIGYLLKKHTSILFVCHNVFPHERFLADHCLTKLALQAGNGYLVHSSMDSKDLLAVKKEANFLLSPLPAFNAFPRSGMTQEQARAYLNICGSPNILLFFGLIREYKGLSYLLEAMPQIIEHNRDTLLIVAGEFNGDKEKYTDLIQHLRINHYIKIFDQYIPDSAVEKFFLASDLIVLPYISATQSAVVQTAFSFERPVIVTNVGGLPEVVVDGRTGYVVESQNKDQLADRIIDFFKLNKSLEFQRNIRNNAYQFSWDKMVERIEHLYEEM